MTAEQVECCAGAGYPERPRAITWEGTRFHVEEILARWKDPAGTGFRVRTPEGQIFELRCRQEENLWLVENK